MIRTRHVAIPVALLGAALTGILAGPALASGHSTPVRTPATVAPAGVIWDSTPTVVQAGVIWNSHPTVVPAGVKWLAPSSGVVSA